MLLQTSSIYSGVVVVVALFFHLSQGKIGIIKKGSEYCVRVFVCDDTLLFSISSEATDAPFQENSDSGRAWTMRRSDGPFSFPINK